MRAMEKTLIVKRTARYQQLGDINPKTKEIWFTLHGYGQLSGYFIRHFKPFEREDRCIVAPEALSRFYLERDGGRVGATWMTKEDRLNEMEDYISYLNTLFTHLTSSIDQPKEIAVTILGFSQGVSTAMRWALRGNASVNRIILWAGSIPPEVNLKAERDRINSMNPVFVVGTDDQFISAEHRQQAVNHLKRHGINCPIITFEGKHVIHAATLKKLLG
ncbi:MAG: dienelactone hydrolase family protein [Calditrichota bacterium]